MSIIKGNVDFQFYSRLAKRMGENGGKRSKMLSIL